MKTPRHSHHPHFDETLWGLFEQAAVFSERIDIDPAVTWGQPRVRGTRLTVGWILDQLSRKTLSGVMESYPQLKREDILEALRFAAAVLSPGIYEE